MIILYILDLSFINYIKKKFIIRDTVSNTLKKYLIYYIVTVLLIKKFNTENFKTKKF